MRVSTPGLDKSYEANADLSASQWCAVVPTAGPAGGVQARVALSGSNARAIGILQNKPSAAGLAAVIRLSGTSKMKVDGNASAIAAGDPLKSNGSGLGVKAATDKDKVLAIAMEPSTVANDIIEVLLAPYDLAV